MTDFDEFEHRLALALRADADQGAPGFDPAQVARAAIVAARRPVGLAPRPWRRTTLARLAVAAAIAVLAVGSALYVTRPNHSDVGGPSHSPALVSPSTSVPARPAAWTATGSMTTPRMNQTATRLPDGRVLVVGGTSPGPEAKAERTAELYDPATGTWAATGSMIEARIQGHTATLLANGRVLVAGGRGAPGETTVGLASAEVFDPASGTWTATGSMIEDLMDHTATLLPNGMVLVAGGLTSNDTSASASAELYDPGTGTWTATGSMATARGGHTATLLPDGRVAVAGGSTADGLSPSAELYDPRAGTWIATGSMTVARAFHTATLLLDGQVLVAGGFTGNGIAASAELYDPATGTWTATGSMITTRVSHTATLLLDGQVLVAGGAIAVSPTGNTLLASAELYDPATGTWTSTLAMAMVREHSTATLLPSGSVLIAGGDGGVYPQSPHEWLASAELYHPGIP